MGVAGEVAPPARGHDVVVYGGSSAGIAAAVQVKRQGKSVIVLEPGRQIGGLTTGGLGYTDIGNKHVIGGLAREFYERIRRHYADPARWKWQAPDTYRRGWGDRFHHDGVGGDHAGKVFIDATYEGDLLAGAGVDYVVGREANATFGETLNDVQTKSAVSHQFRPGVDPYVKPGDPASGLMPGIDPQGPGLEGSGDRRVQAYCYRMCLTDHPENRIPFEKPADYDPLQYELLLRNFEAGQDRVPWINRVMPNRKTDTNNGFGVSTDFIGGNYAYPEADDAERVRIAARHLAWQQGLMWTLANHERVPEKIRNEVARWGMCRDEFVEGRGWQDQLYVREARRMVGATVMTQHHCQGRERAQRSVGMAAYNMDSHNVQRYVDAAGHVRNEGDVQVPVKPYAIEMSASRPRAWRSIPSSPARPCRTSTTPPCGAGCWRTGRCSSGSHTEPRRRRRRRRRRSPTCSGR